MTDKEFESGYAYNVRHTYGKVGKRTDYSPYSCMKIINGQIPASDDTHGCPFRHQSTTQLRASLSDDLTRMLALQGPVSGGQQTLAGATVNSAVNELVGLVNAHHYQIACKRFYELSHPEDDVVQNDLIIQHPNQFYEESEAYWTRREKK
eukprot:TRINITY_DN8134_c0_g1_i1.p1 TRINITY_DN8134_c0_g1~~TRINITY_DN8134_c0_g1_i1.p1  ORF type:complete len:158 (-),score=18.58 TRINITY_DN8134_c0_g1_i1:29-478(-)